MSFFSKALDSVKSVFVGLGKAAPALTTVATTVEIATGHSELVGLTQKAGEAAAKVGEKIGSQGSVVEAVSEQVSEVAASEGSTKVANVAEKVSKVAKKLK